VGLRPRGRQQDVGRDVDDVAHVGHRHATLLHGQVDRAVRLHRRDRHHGVLQIERRPQDRPGQTRGPQGGLDLVDVSDDAAAIRARSGVMDDVRSARLARGRDQVAALVRLLGTVEQAHVDPVDAGDRGVQRCRVAQIGDDDLCALLAQGLGLARVVDECPHTSAGGEQRGDEARAGVAGGARDENQWFGGHGLFSCGWWSVLFPGKQPRPPLRRGHLRMAPLRESIPRRNIAKGGPELG
jgi:hypothetical protein